jgi:hypothetical protein
MTRQQEIHLAQRRNMIADAVVLCRLHLQFVYALYLILISNSCFVIKKNYSLTKLEILMRWYWLYCALNFETNSIVPDQEHQPQYEDDYSQGCNDVFQKFTDVSEKPVTSICKVEALKMDETYALCIRIEVMVVSVSL